MRLFLLLIFAAHLSAWAEVPTPTHPAEKAAWEKLAARFTAPPALKTDSAKVTEVMVSGIAGKPSGTGSASITIDKASGHVVEVTSNGAGFRDEDFAAMGKFHELRAITLWHNGGYTAVGLEELNLLPKLERITLAGGSLGDTGMAVLAQFRALHELRAWHCPFSDIGVAAFRRNVNLVSIQIGPNWEPLLTDKTVEHLAFCPNLKKLSLNETWLTWEGGLKHLAPRKGQLTLVDFGDCLIDPAAVERLRQALPGTEVKWGGLVAAGQALQKKINRTRAERWIPQELLEQAAAAAGPAPTSPGK